MTCNFPPLSSRGPPPFPTITLSSSPPASASATPPRSPQLRAPPLSLARDPRTQATSSLTPPANPERPLDVYLPGPPRSWQPKRSTTPAIALSGTRGGSGPRMTPRHQPPCPGGQYTLKPGACITAQRGESLPASLLALVVVTPLACFACFFAQ